MEGCARAARAWRKVRGLFCWFVGVVT